MSLRDLPVRDLERRQRELEARLERFRAEKLSLDLTRGKPSPAQLDLSSELDGILDGFYLLQDGTDVRNYGGLSGIPEARRLGADILDVAPQQVLAGGNSSLTLMYTMIAHMMEKWSVEAAEQGGRIRFLCPVPGYDRHFTICEHFGIEMINVDMLDTGPDMDVIEALLADDPMIKGIWCVPKYSNPTGHTCDAETVRRMARLADIAGRDFRVMWDNAYAVHHLTEDPVVLHNVMAEAEKAGNEDSIVMFASTSKITFAGAGIAFLATSVDNLQAFQSFLVPQVIGFDKVNQLRHVRFLKDMDHLAAHMDRHRELLAPKFAIVQNILSAALDSKGIATWTQPKGGYFVSLDTLPGLAGEVVDLAADAGVKLTPAGATYPYGHDPENRNIRIAPTFPAEEDLARAMDVLVVCLELASVRHCLELPGHHPTGDSTD